MNNRFRVLELNLFLDEFISGASADRWIQS